MPIAVPNPQRLAPHQRLTLIAAGVLSGFYVLYAMVVVPLVSPPPIGSTDRHWRHGPEDQSGPAENRAIAAKHLTEHPWAARADYQVHSEGTFVYFNEWEPVDSAEAIRFTPFALVWMPEDDEQREPITIHSDSAYVRFAGKFELRNPHPGRIIGGALEGDVEIRGPNGLKVEGRNVHFSEAAMLLYCDTPVEFAYGDHRGNAHGLQVELIPDEVARQQEKLAVSGFKNVRLRRNVTMDLQPESDKPNEVVRPVRVQSDGSFLFVVETNIATFEDNVRVNRPTGPDQSDMLYCNLLEITFVSESATKEKATLNVGSNEFRGIDEDLAFRYLKATGDSVVLVSQENDLSAQMRELNFDDQTQTAILKHDQFVRVWRDNSELRAPQITLVHGEDGKVASVTCDGAGSLKRLEPETGRLEFAGSWGQQLVLTRDPETGQDVIDLHQQALLRQPEEEMGLAAEFIRVWLRTEDESAQKQSEDQSDRFRPQRLEARGDVAMISPELQAQAKRLEVEFEENPAAISKDFHHRFRQSTVANSDRRRRTRTSLTLTNDRTPHGAGLAAVADDFLNEPPAQPDDGPIEVVADSIRVRMIPGKGERKQKVSEVWAEDQVHIRQEHFTDEAPLEIDGDSVHVTNRTEDDRLLHVIGEPAHIRDRGMHIAGDDIHLDQGTNRAWVVGRGLLQLPVDETLDGKKLPQPVPLDIRWAEKMDFDGRSARFFGQVRAELQDSRLDCEAMHVLLTETIHFSKPPRDARKKIKVARVVCEDGVQVESFEREAGRLVAVTKARFAQLLMNQTTGQSNAQGPGWVRIWRRESNAPSSATDTTQPIRTNSSPASDAKEWTYTRIDFADRTEGQIDKQLSTFYDRVQVVYGPVTRSLETIDPDRLPADAGLMLCRELEVRRHKETETRPAYSDMLARGNVKLQGRSFDPSGSRTIDAQGIFSAMADEIGYDESTGMYLLRAYGTRTARIWRQTSPGAEYNKGEAQRMEFIPHRNSLKLFGTKGLDGLR